MYLAPPVPIDQQARGVRLTGLWGGGVGTALLLFLAAPVLTTIGLARWGDTLSGPSDGSMFHGGEVFFTWVLANLVALIGIVLCGLAALVLDIIMLIKISALRSAGVASNLTRPLLMSVLTGMALISTPVGLALMLIANVVLGPGAALKVVQVVLVILLFLVPIAGRVAEGVLAARIPARLAVSGGAGYRTTTW